MNMITELSPLDITRLIQNSKGSKRMGRFARHKLRILERDHFKCRYCNRSENLTITHINHHGRKARRNAGNLDPNNCKTLCIECHLLIDRGKT